MKKLLLVPFLIAGIFYSCSDDDINNYDQFQFIGDIYEFREKGSAYEHSISREALVNQFINKGNLPTPEKAISIVFFDVNHKTLITHAMYEASKSKNEQSWEERYMSLENYNRFFDDEYAKPDYLQEVPYVSDKPMYIYDPYEYEETRMGIDKRRKLMDAIMKEGNLGKAVTGGVPRIGSFFFQYGNWWTPDGPWWVPAEEAIYVSCNAGGASDPGHVSVVLTRPAGGAAHTLNDFEIVEAWYRNKTGGGFEGEVRRVTAQTTWGGFQNETCTNFWHILGTNATDEANMNNWMTARVNIPYGTGIKDHSNNMAHVEPAYYCSLFAWQVYRTVMGWDMDNTGGPIVSPNDVAFSAYFRFFNPFLGNRFSPGDF